MEDYIIRKGYGDEGLRKLHANNPEKIGGDIVSFLNKSPFQLHAFGGNYAGPGTHLDLNLEKGLLPTSEVDHAAMFHDVDYAEHKNLPDRHRADHILENKMKKTSGVEAKVVQGIMHMKRKLGLGVEPMDDLVDRMDRFLIKNKDINETVHNSPKKTITLESWYTLREAFPKRKLMDPQYCSNYSLHKQKKSRLFKSLYKN